ncbi:hypothetical protein [Allomesorhizobium camelthorni]|uniref:Uncharacterized protein n=1 Tax=Allomesorhizobium camelthorni TaxID=475069 RepID=A0A6G4W8J2_9HYPH|nr:hypothetical protein [Mesorhizobium camelthorni]NGO50874.1 hypothetical protein [Mesorhizobium camelthorni]
MLRQISEDVRVNLKDRLRDVRHVIRQSRHDHARNAAVEAEGRNSPSSPAKGLEDLLGHAASVVDDAMSLAEALVPHERPASADAATVRSFEHYFRSNGRGPSLDGERAFRRDMYYLAKAIATRKTTGAPRIYEASLAAAHAAMRKRHADLIAELDIAAEPDERVAVAAVLSAALLIELVEHRPIRFGESAQGRNLDLEVRFLAPLALACGLATIGVDDLPAADMLEITMLAADVRHDRIVQAYGKADRLGDLTTVFAVLLAHLP